MVLFFRIILQSKQFKVSLDFYYLDLENVD